MKLERVAVLSDIHGVLPALEAVLAEPEVAAAERIVLTGDITAGPPPSGRVDSLAGPPTPRTLPPRGRGKVVFCHAPPRDEEEVVLVDSRLDRWTEVFT